MVPLLLAFVLAQSPEELELARDLGLESLAAPDEATLRRMVEQTLPKVAREMGVEKPAPLKMRVLTREEASSKLKQIIERDYPGDRMARLGAALQMVGLLEPGLDLGALLHDLYSRHVSGFYDQHDATLYLLDSQPLAMQSMVVPHEIAHALQDRKIGIERAIRERRDSEDAQLALSAALEGHAQAVAARVMTSEVEGGGELASMLMEATAASAEQAGSGEGLPPWIALQLSFPYAGGNGLVHATQKDGGPVSSLLIDRIPASTAQVLDPELYRANEKPLSGNIGLGSLLPGASKPFVTTLGRADADLLGRMHGGGESLGKEWRGDRLEIVRLGGRDVGAWAVAFRDLESAHRFASVLARALGAQREGSGYLAVHADGTMSAIRVRNGVVGAVIRAPAERAGEIAAAALSAFE